MMVNLAELKETIFRARGTCELCGWRRATQLHHCLVHDSKRYHDLITVPENLMPVCEICHTSLAQVANGYEVKRTFAERQVALGYDIAGWYGRLPLKIKERWLLEIGEE
jgi:hypothetical protein